MESWILRTPWPVPAPAFIALCWRRDGGPFHELQLSESEHGEPQMRRGCKSLWLSLPKPEILRALRRLIGNRQPIGNDDRRRIHLNPVSVAKIFRYFQRQICVCCGP